MIVNQLQYYLDSCGHISEKQAGFGRSSNTTEQIVRLTQHIKDSFQKMQSTLVVFVDFKAAFDRVWRKMLLKKLLHMHVSGHFFKWISDFLSQRFLNIKYGNSRLGYGQTRQGLPQGSILSPVLFNIMINDLLSFIDNAVPEINSLLYGDDLVFWSTSSDIPKFESTLSSALVTLANWPFENDFKPPRPLSLLCNCRQISSSSERLQYSAFSLGERLMRKEHFWPNYIPSQTRLKTQHTFLFEFQRLANVFGVSNNRLSLFRPTILSGHLRYASANLDLVLPVHKHNSLPAELRSAALATIRERHPDQNWLHVFTDGSATASFGRAGAFSNSFNLKEPLSAWSDNFDGKIYTIFMAFRAISTTPGLNIVIFIDSQDTIKTAYLATIPILPDGQRHAQLFALPRVEGVVCFRIITRHDYLQAHLFKIVLADSQLYPLCKSMPMTEEHLSDCPALLHVLLPARATSALYWIARGLMSERTLVGVI
ncbi:putative RNA-directed DNA polymerase from transposon BS [Trichonephila clavipes]|nr:putative RNA-directed DNA polymerase from transposon BS [Trichonephila clavipes]